MRKTLFAALMIMAVIPFIAGPATAEAGTKNVSKLIGTHSKKIRDLKNSRNFAKKRVLLVIGGQKRATTVEGLLEGVSIALSEPQHSIFIDPLVLAENQEMGYVSVRVNGPFVKSVELSKQPPAEHKGLAALVISYSGDTTLPLQALVNIRAQ